MVYLTQEIKKAYKAGGFRERYAIENGEARVVIAGGRRLIKFTYSKADPYQDANGATFDTLRGVWIG